MDKKKKPELPKPRKVWDIDPGTRIQRLRTAYDRHREKEDLKRGLWGEEEEEEEEQE